MTCPQSRILAAIAFLCAAGAAHGAWWEGPKESAPLIALPMDSASATQQWVNTEYWEAVESDELQRKVMHPTRLSYLATREALEPPYEVTLHARWIDREAPRYGASLYVGATTLDIRSEPPAYRVYLRPYMRGTRRSLNIAVSRGNRIINTIVDKRQRRYDDRRMNFARRFDTISPVWDADFRAEIEAAMAPIEDPDMAWFRLRVVVGEDVVQFFKDGICIGEYQHPESTVGRVVLEARDPSLHVASLTVSRPAVPQVRYQVVGLDQRVNAAAIGAKTGFALADDALPPGGSTIEVEGIPFRLPHRERGDHIDLGVSLYHYRNNDQRVNMRTMWLPPGTLDANRIILGVPNRAYRRLWVLAASDDDPNSVPLLTARFYRQTAGFPIDAQAEIPVYTARSAKGVTALPVDGPGGEPRRLWLVPIELDGNRIASEFREQETLAIELTKGVEDYTPYPDPMYFSSFQSGPPSAVRLFAATLEELPVTLTTKGTRPGSVFLRPEHPVWESTLRNTRDTPLAGALNITVTDPYGETLSEYGTTIRLLPRETRVLTVPFKTELYGLHDVVTSFAVEEGVPRDERVKITDDGRFVQLPPDNRRTTEKTSRWGLWCWHGGHLTNPDPDENSYLLRASGARGVGPREYADRARWGLFARPVGLSYRAPRWAFDEPDNMEAREAHARDMVEKAKAHVEKSPDAGYLCYFVEDVADMALMFGEYPKHLGEKGTNWTEEQKHQYEARFLAAKVALEAVRKEVPKARISLGWTHPQFQVPLLRMGFPPELFDAIGIDFPTFMRMPEMPLVDISPNRMWVLKTEMDRLGYGNKPIVHHETYFPSSQPQALGEDAGADYTVRYGVLSIALGSERLMHCFSLHDCAGYWGTQHYGASGLVGRYPEFRPKPAFPSYAVMTRLLDSILPAGFVHTGSMSTYCVAFRNRNTMVPYTYVYALWTLRGNRDVSLAFASEDEAATRIDAQGNEQALTLNDGMARLSLSPRPVWVTSVGEITNATLVGDAVYDDAPSGPVVELGTLADGWAATAEAFERLEQNSPIRAPYAHVAMDVSATAGPDGGKALSLALGETPEERPTVDWYTVLEPKAPVAIPGRAKALGLWANGRTSWGRVMYEVVDAKGERFLSTGAKENWNGDDSRQASYFNFDGWRYIEFPLPNHAPYDHFRSFNTVWWGWDQEGVVDLPIKLTKIVVTHRTHHVYVNELLPVPEPRVDLGRLVAVYDSEADRGDDVIARHRMPAFSVPETDLSLLPNPYKERMANSELPPTRIKEFFKPQKWYDGTQIMVDIEPVENPRDYRVYVSAYPDGTAAMPMGIGTEIPMLIRRLRPEYPLYFFVTYTAQNRQESKPSEIKRVLLKDDFPNK